MSEESILTGCPTEDEIPSSVDLFVVSEGDGDLGSSALPVHQLSQWLGGSDAAEFRILTDHFETTTTETLTDELTASYQTSELHYATPGDVPTIKNDAEALTVSEEEILDLELLPALNQNTLQNTEISADSTKDEDVSIDSTNPMILGPDTVVTVNGKKCILKHDSVTGQCVAFPLREETKTPRPRGRPRKVRKPVEYFESETRSSRKHNTGTVEEDGNCGLLVTATDEGEIVKRSSRKRKTTSALKDYEMNTCNDEISSASPEEEPTLSQPDYEYRDRISMYPNKARKKGKRKRGRPRKSPPFVEKIKRPVGRPRRNTKPSIGLIPILPVPQIIGSCEICSCKLNSEDEIQSHYREFHFGCMCDKCGYLVKSSGLLKQHTYQVHSQGSAVCDICDKVFKDYYTMRNHQRSVHVAPSVLFQCAVCSKTFSHRNRLNRHIRIHDTSTYYDCPLCTYKGAERTSLEKHMAVHKDPTFPCPVCGRYFRYLKNRDIHIKRYSDYVTYKRSSKSTVSVPAIESRW